MAARKKTSLLEELKKLLQKDDRFTAKGQLLKNTIVEHALKLDKDLIKLLLSQKRIQEHFFIEVGGTLIFDKDKFISFVDNKQFLPDSYTAFKNKIGLTIDGKDDLAGAEKIILQFHKFDQSGQSFRYLKDRKGKSLGQKLPKRVDLERLKKTVEGLFNFFDGCGGVLSEA